MTRLSKVLIAAAAMLAVPVHSAMAQDPVEGTEGEAPVEGTPEDATGTPPEGAMPADTAVPGSWPQRIKDRPLNLLKGMIRAQGDLGISRIAGMPAMPPIPATDATTVLGLQIGGGYGVSDKLEVGASYAFTLNEFEIKGPLTLYGLFNLKHSEKLRASAGASFGYNLAAERVAIGAGVAFQYHLNDKMFVFMPPSHISLGLDPTQFSINLPVGFGFQANEKIFAYGQTNLFDIGIEPSGSAFIFADRTPLTIGAFYSSSNKMDIGAAFTMPNVPDIADVFAITLTARLFLGDVPASGNAAAATVSDPMNTPPPM